MSPRFERFLTTTRGTAIMIPTTTRTIVSIRCTAPAASILGPDSASTARSLARRNIRHTGAAFRSQTVAEVEQNGRLSRGVAWRALATSYTTARLQDPTGNSGDFVGHQLEAQVHYNPLPGNLDAGISAAPGWRTAPFLREMAPNAPNEGDTTLHLRARRWPRVLSA